MSDDLIGDIKKRIGFLDHCIELENSYLQENDEKCGAYERHKTERYFLQRALSRLEWVPVSERLPDESTKQVFVWDGDAKKVSACEFPCGWEGMLSHKWITHWKEITPPTGED